MAIIPVPASLRFSAIPSLKLQRATNILRSKFTGQAQRIVYPFAVWMLEGTLVETDGIAAGQIRSFFVQLEGQKNSFRLRVPGYVRPNTYYGNFSQKYNPYCSVAAPARASSITVQDPNSNFPANQTFLNEGDYITIQDELKIVTAPIAFNATSQAVITFKPPLRKAVGAGVTVVVQEPTVLLTAQGDDVASWSIAPPIRQSGKILAIEAIDV